MKAEFTPSLLTGNEMIDGHHKELFKRSNDLFEAIENNAGKEKVAEVLGFLAEYTKFHFSAEEELMGEINYPKAGVHKKAHADLINVVKELSYELNSEGVSAEFEEKVYEKVVDWLYNHIKGSDQELAQYKMIGNMENFQ